MSVGDERRRSRPTDIFFSSDVWQHVFPRERDATPSQASRGLLRGYIFMGNLKARSSLLFSRVSFLAEYRLSEAKQIGSTDMRDRPCLIRSCEANRERSYNTTLHTCN